MSNHASGNAIRIALLGAGIYAQGAHLPALLELGDRVQIAAVFSRTQAAADALAARAGADVTATTELRELLARPDIDAVDIMLPIPMQADVVEAALEAGKHVISEKPIAPNSVRARQLLACHDHHLDRVWMVGENWRYEEAFERAAQMIAEGAIGQPLVGHWSRFVPIRPGNPYYATEWRRSGFAGGMLLDGVVHLVAALRLVLGEIESVAAHTALVAPDLPPVDTLSASIRFTGGATLSLMASYAMESPWGTPLTIVGEHGSLRVDRGRVELARSSGAPEVIECGKMHGVQRELAAFVDAIGCGMAHRNTPEEALRDLVVVEAMLEAGQTGLMQRVSV